MRRALWATLLSGGLAISQMSSSSLTPSTAISSGTCTPARRQASSTSRARRSSRASSATGLSSVRSHLADAQRPGLALVGGEVDVAGVAAALGVLAEDLAGRRPDLLPRVAAVGE